MFYFSVAAGIQALRPGKEEETQWIARRSLQRKGLVTGPETAVGKRSDVLCTVRLNGRLDRQSARRGIGSCVRDGDSGCDPSVYNRIPDAISGEHH